MTVAPNKHSDHPGSSSSSDTSPRSGRVQMDEIDVLRLKLSSEDSVSLASSVPEPINLEDAHYALLREELESDAQNLEAESWSVAVDQNYLKALHKEAVKRQDVIYELIQTEMNHVRTLKILLHVYMHKLKQSLLIEEAKLEQLFLGVDALLTLHQHFLNCLKIRQNQSQEERSPNGYQISQLGDILISQFSGALGEKMKDWYSVFCSHHKEAISSYKEQQQNNKKLQSLIRKIGQLPLVRRLGIPECFLLVTQRITKYPVLVERIIQNTEADTDEYKSLVQGLALIKDTISQVNDQVCEYEKAARLREIGLRLEPKSQGRLKDGRLFRREDLIQGNRTLLYEGTVTWKSSGRQKDIHAVLLSDVLLLLQEKDQKLVFAAVDNKPPVISLQRLIVREVAHEDKAMFLICACTSTMPEMYEIHTGSREECISWMAYIREAVNCYPEEEELYSEQTARLQEYQDVLKEKDDQIKQSLTEKLQVFAALYEVRTGQETPHRGLLLRGDATDLQQGATLLNGAINEVENLQNLLLFRIRANPLDGNKMQGSLRRAETLRVTDSNLPATAMKNGDAAEWPGGSEGITEYGGHSSSDPQLQEMYYSESQEQSADDDTQMPHCNPSSEYVPEAEVCDRVILLAQRLYSLQTIIAQQDSQIELQRTLQLKSKPARQHSNVLFEQEKQRNLEKQKEELANLHKLQAQHREEQQRWEKERDRQSVQIERLESQLKEREEECRKWEERLNEEKAELERQRENYQQDLERLRDSTQSVEKDKERLTQEKERLEQQQEKLKKYISNINLGLSNYDDPTHYSSLSRYQSMRGSIVNGGRTLTQVLPSICSDPEETPPKVPPRKESISPQPPKPELPVHLISATNQDHKPAPVQQQIPTKLATLTKGKEKVKTKASHQRTHSAASIDVNQVLPIRVTGKEGGSLRAKRTASPQRIYQSDAFIPPGSVHSVKTSQSFSTHKRSNSEAPPPPPPPFPKEVLKTGKTGKEKVVFL